jgi:magnesium chelatase family protein
MDRMDLRLVVYPVGRSELFGQTAGETSAVVRERVLAARDRAARRFAGCSWQTNARIPGQHLRGDFAPEPDSVAELEKRYQTGALTARGYDRLLRVAWTIADLHGRDRPGREEIRRAMAFRQGLPGQLAT